MHNVVYVATRTERGEAGDYDFSVEVFATQEAADEWVEAQISKHVASCKLVDTDVDGWFVKLNGWNHTVQYDVAEKSLNG